MLRDILNDHRWHTKDLPGLELTVLHRGAPGDIRVVPGFAIEGITASGIHLIPQDEEEEGAFIPYHRILRIDGPDGLPLWTKPS